MYKFNGLVIGFRKGDYYRYVAEFKTDQDRKEAAEQSLKGYEVCNMFTLFSNERSFCRYAADLTFLFVAIFTYTRLLLRLQARIFLQLIQFVLALPLTSLSSIMRLWIPPRGISKWFSLFELLDHLITCMLPLFWNLQSLSFG